MAVQAGQIGSRPTTTTLNALSVALVVGTVLGIAVGYGVPVTYLIIGLLIPFSLLLMLARPHLAAMAYVALVYTDFLSILVTYHGMPPLARFAGWALFGAVLGYRLIVRREGLVGDRVTLWLAAYGLVVAVGLLYARSFDLVLTNVVEFTRIFLAYLIVINTITTTGRLRRTLSILLGAGVLLSSLTIFQALTRQYENEFWGLAQFRVSEITGTSDAPRPGGTLGDANYYGQSLLILIPIGLYLLAEGRSRLSRIAGGLASLALIGAIILTYSRGDAVAMGTVLVAALLYKRPNPLYLLGGIVAFIIAVPFLPSNYVSRLTTIVDVASSSRQAILSEESVRGRAGATQAAIEMFQDYPLLGVGRENYPLYQPEYLAGTSFARSARGIPPHNLYLEVAAEHGLLGIVVVGGLLFMTWRALFEARRRFRSVGDRRHSELAAWLSIGFLGYLVSSLFLHGAHIWMLGLQISLIVALRQLSRAAAPDLLSPQLPALDPIGVRAPSLQQTLTPSHELAGTPERSAFLPTRRARYKAAPETASALAGGDARLRVWLDAAEGAWVRGDEMTARALVDAILARDPHHEAALQLDNNLRQNAPIDEPPAPPRVGDGISSAATEPPVPDATEPMADVAKPRNSYRVAAPFRNYWERNGGARLFGPPISAPFIEPTREGRAVIVQYFTRARMEHHPEHKGTPYEVALSALGTELAPAGASPSPPPDGLGGQQVSLSPGSIETPWKFSVFWNLNGGESALGLPVTPLVLEATPVGSLLAVQYFERARLEYHASLAGTVGEVQLGELGRELFEARYGGKRYVF